MVKSDTPTPAPLFIHALARNIITSRLRLKLTQAELARRVGISVSVLRNIEHERTEPRTETLLRLCEVLGLTLDEMITTPRELQCVRFRMPL